MSRNNADKNMPVGRMSRVGDFLPPPENLAMPEETVKITMCLSRSSVEFFKQQAGRHHMKYQRMIRSLVDIYTAHYMRH